MASLREINTKRNQMLRWKAENDEYERLKYTDPDAANAIIMKWADEAAAHAELVENKPQMAYLKAKAKQSAERMVPKFRADDRRKRLRRNRKLKLAPQKPLGTYPRAD